MSDRPILSAVDVGNGKVAGLSSEIKGTLKNPVVFEPVFAPISTRRGLDEARPTFTLMQDDQVFVFGVDDVHEHGELNKARRANNEERYGSADYMMLVRALLLQMFPGQRGKDRISPNLILSVPIEQYNNDKIVRDLKTSICGITTIDDMENCTLRLKIDPKRVLIIPESAGAINHYAFDETTRNPRPKASTVGITAVIDIGYLTTNVSLFEGMAYRKDAAFTVERGGFGVVVNDIWTKIRPYGRAMDLSELDRSLKAVAGIPMGKDKKIDIGGSAKVNVKDVYDPAVDALANLIVQSVLNRLQGIVTRILITGGGQYHLGGIIKALVPESIEVVFAPNPELANVYGAFTMLVQKAAQAGKFITD